MMSIIWPKPGKYLVAVSGGVDSVCLLRMLADRGDYELIVAHVDHGIRDDSAQDAELVRELAEKNKFNIVITKLNSEKNTSENWLREERYAFLFEQMEEVGTEAIITAHHADDLLETSILNVQRGTDRYGAAGGMSREGIIRPLINVSKQELISYARKHQLEWREDSTNTDVKYARNKVRHGVIPNIDRNEYQKNLIELGELNKKIDSELAGSVLVSKGKVIVSRKDVNSMSLRELEVLFAYAIRQIDPSLELSQPQIARLAREILLDATKNSFSYGSAEGIIIEIQ